MFNTREIAHALTAVAFSFRTRRHALDGAANVSRRDTYRTGTESTLNAGRGGPT